jgi:hypothetical protein
MLTIKYKWHEAMLYKVTGDPISIKPTDGKEEFETSELQTFIEGYLGFIKQANIAQNGWVGVVSPSG